jgi:UDP-glucose 4-epimerase
VKILIVGGAGYIGSHMVRYLHERTRYPVTVLDNLAKGHREAVTAELVVGDYGDHALVESLCRDRGITALMHFGADSLVGESVADPARYYENNVVKGKRLIDAAVAAGVKRVIFSSTAACYGEPARVPIREDDPTAPTNPYGWTKLAFESLLASYDAAYGLPHICLRYFNAAGAHESGQIGEDHQPETHLIPLVLQVALGRREAITVFGIDYPTMDGTCVRDYIHVDDLVAAHLLALESLAQGGPSGVYNLGNGEGFSVQQVIDVCRQVTGKPIPTVTGPRRPGDPPALIAAADRAHDALGWTPNMPELTQIVDSAWRWHRNHPDGYVA